MGLIEWIIDHWMIIGFIAVIIIFIVLLVSSSTNSSVNVSPYYRIS